jgi:hypothetical protein
MKTGTPGGRPPCRPAAASANGSRSSPRSADFSFQFFQRLLSRFCFLLSTFCSSQRQLMYRIKTAIDKISLLCPHCTVTANLEPDRATPPLPRRAGPVQERLFALSLQRSTFTVCSAFQDFRVQLLVEALRISGSQRFRFQVSALSPQPSDFCFLFSTFCFSAAPQISC